MSAYLLVSILIAFVAVLFVRRLYLGFWASLGVGSILAVVIILELRAGELIDPSVALGLSGAVWAGAVLATFAFFLIGRYCRRALSAIS